MTSKDADGLLRLGVDGEAAVPRAHGGRGCYICRDPRCATTAVRDRQISRALSRGAGRVEQGKAPASGPVAAKGRAGAPRVKVKEPGLDRLLEWIGRFPLA